MVGEKTELISPLIEELRDIVASLSEEDEKMLKQLESLSSLDDEKREVVFATLRNRFGDKPAILQKIDVYDPNSLYGQRWAMVMEAWGKDNVEELTRLTNEFDQFLAEKYPYLPAWGALSRQFTDRILSQIRK